MGRLHGSTLEPSRTRADRRKEDEREGRTPSNERKDPHASAPQSKRSGRKSTRLDGRGRDAGRSVRAGKSCGAWLIDVRGPGGAHQLRPLAIPVSGSQVPPCNLPVGGSLNSYCAMYRGFPASCPLADQNRRAVELSCDLDRAPPLLFQIVNQQHADSIAHRYARVHSVLLCHKHSEMLLTCGMKTIGAIRRERLAELMRQRDLTYAAINDKLGRNRRDATLSQIAQAAPDSKTKKPREMGDAQARAIEAAFELGTGWFDRDPEFDALEQRYRTLQTTIAEKPATYGPAWPFRKVTLEQISRLPPELIESFDNVLFNLITAQDAVAHQASESQTTTELRRVG